LLLLGTKAPSGRRVDHPTATLLNLLVLLQQLQQVV
jgi:hypothetical protein